MRVLVIGGTGHIGSYLVPRLVAAGHDVTVIARRAKPQYTDPRIHWPRVHWIEADKGAEEADGRWSRRMGAIETDIVVDLLCQTPLQNQMMVEAFRGRIRHFLHCGTIWAYGPTERAPYEEHFPRRPTGSYGINKAAVEAILLAQHRETRFPATIIHPGQIGGRRWLPVDPQATINGVGIYARLATEQEVCLPDLGLAMLHHVHGDDVAQIFERAIAQPQAAIGESFSAVGPYALSLVACCRGVAALFGKEPRIKFLPLEQMRTVLSPEAFDLMLIHVSRSPCSSIEKSRRLLGYAPHYTTEMMYQDCVEHLLESGQLKV
jgi:nucleoside-diphosphate-sugar epimerase